ncbi:hypothetical protein O3M35_003786 [Rhynocoris fuscipes]|uniref:Beta-hexosaminidase n=1 Tax=Rhynocoris fuscipes TaxID=488301 RepID=A0AAW1CHF4_9HEMI
MSSIINSKLFLFYISLFFNFYQVLSRNIGPFEEIGLQTDSIWTWECKENGCTKVEAQSSCASDGKCEKIPIVSQEVCNLLCPPGNLWPQPNGNVYISPKYVVINSRSIALDLHPKDLKKDNQENESYNTIKKSTDLFLERFNKLERSEKANTIGHNVVINLLIENADIYKYTTGVDESYCLNISLSNNNMVNITIRGNTFLGVRHGLETLSQLIVFDSLNGFVVTPLEVQIKDKPAFTHRGLSIDTARNFISVKSLLRTLDAMAAVKLNTLHWHITDSHSFPFASKLSQQFAKYGAYSPDKVYNEDDIMLLNEYARLRGIRIVPELDLPAHVGEGWQASPGSVVCFNAQPWTQYCVEPPCGQIDPTSHSVYNVLQDLYKDFNRLFDGDMFHMGGDEVNLNCWNSTEIIVNNMKELGYDRSSEGFHRLWSDFQKKAKDIFEENGGKGKQLVLWTSSLTEGNVDSYINSTDYIIQVWTKGNDPTIAHLLKKNFKIILSNYEALYFDCGFGAWVGSGNNWCSPYIPWQTVYENTPEKILKQQGLDSGIEQILGSEGALWTEQADDSSIDNRFWPRGAALAESLWSPGKKWQTAEKRYLIQRERFVTRGIAADTVQPEWCRKNQGSCYL